MTLVDNIDNATVHLNTSTNNGFNIIKNSNSLTGYITFGYYLSTNSTNPEMGKNLLHMMLTLVRCDINSHNYSENFEANLFISIH